MHVTSSPCYHQSNGRAERAVATIEQILKKSASDIDITKTLTTYLDTPVTDTLPSPAELFQNRRINTRLCMAMTPAPLTDQQKTHLSDKRSAHLKSSKQDNNIYLPSQPFLVHWWQFRWVETRIHWVQRYHTRLVLDHQWQEQWKAPT